jgi:hypothetical protein
LLAFAGLEFCTGILILTAPVTASDGQAIAAS